VADTSTDLTIEDVLLENDDFRLAIRGFAFLEDALASVIGEALKRGRCPAS